VGQCDTAPNTVVVPPLPCVGTWYIVLRLYPNVFQECQRSNLYYTHKLFFELKTGCSNNNRTFVNHGQKKKRSLLQISAHRGGMLHLEFATHNSREHVTTNFNSTRIWYSGCLVVLFSWVCIYYASRGCLLLHCCLCVLLRGVMLNTSIVLCTTKLTTLTTTRAIKLGSMAENQHKQSIYTN